MPRVTALTMLEFQAAVARNPWLILPVGTTEEHGPHLPLGADTLQ
ncbi:MAG: creatininase family protein, partial [Candidatus Methylomirabilales bacterium]